MQQSVTPKTDEEWTIQSLNIHGTLFERRCRYVIAQVPEWNLHPPYYPVEFPITLDGRKIARGKPSNLDIWAEWKASDGIHSIMLPVECKKCNPELAHWVFFPMSSNPPSTPMVRVHQTDGQSYSSSIVLKSLQTDLVITDEARETRSDYQKAKQGDKTKTANTAITDAATQITIAAQFLLTQEKRIMDQRTRNINNPAPPLSRQVFLPAIVTTAHLFTCDFLDADVDLETGEIPLSKASLTPHPYLFYNYPVPYALQSAPESETRDTLGQQAYMPILVVESTAFPGVLQKLKELEISGNLIELYMKPGKQP